MAHFAKLNKQGFVIAVLPVDDAVIIDPDTGEEKEELGIQYLTQWSGGHPWWAQTSYNTKHGNHLTGGTAFRKNYARMGGTYDAVRDMFVDPKLKDSDVLDETTGSWIASTQTVLENQNGPRQTETGIVITEAPTEGFWDWDPNQKTWYLNV